MLEGNKVGTSGRESQAQVLIWLSTLWVWAGLPYCKMPRQQLKIAFFLITALGMLAYMHPHIYSLTWSCSEVYSHWWVHLFIHMHMLTHSLTQIYSNQHGYTHEVLTCALTQISLYTQLFIRIYQYYCIYSCAFLMFADTYSLTNTKMPKNSLTYIDTHF